MKTQKGLIFGCVCVISVWAVGASSHPTVTQEQVIAALHKAPQTHPSLLVNTDQQKTIEARIASEPFFKALSAAVLKEADRRVGQKPIERVMTGRRLLSVSRECLNRIVSLGMAYRLTGDAKYAGQGEMEMLAAAAFSDWNPSHFLDTAEMTAALGVGYDWFYAALSEESKTTIRNAIVSKGLEPSFVKNDNWVKSHNNWNQVCHGGLTLGALAIRNEQLWLAAKVIERAINNLKFSMDSYEPDGAYPEGPGYWIYGTTYNVAIIAALDSVLGTDFGLSQRAGFEKSADYYLHTTGPSGGYFNYGDCGRGGGGVAPAMFWFARRYQKPYLLYHQLATLRSAVTSKTNTQLGWFSPILLLWGQSTAAMPPALNWMGRGITPVAVFRSSWKDPDAAYLAVKAGRAYSNHAHMDVGSFVYEADGVRWALDLGMQSYNNMEQRGLNIWNRNQDSDRWKIFRYSNFSHNTPTVNGQLHNVKGVSQMIGFSDTGPMPHAVVEMSEIYDGQLEKASRGVGLRNNRQALIQDEWKAGDSAAAVRWQMVSPGKIEVLSPTTARLTEKGKTLLFEVHCPQKIQLKIYPTDPPAEWDEPNPNTSILGFDVALKPQEEMRLAVTLTPGSLTKKQAAPLLTPLREWPAMTERSAVKASAPQ